jgi:hypothetical protein
VLDEIGDICSYSTVMTFVYKVVAFWENIATGFSFVLLRVATKITRKVPKIGILLLEVTQAGRN